MIEQQIAEQQQQVQLAQQAAASSTVISASHLAGAGEVASSPQRNYYMWKDPLQQPQQPGSNFDRIWVWGASRELLRFSRF